MSLERFLSCNSVTPPSFLPHLQTIVPDLFLLVRVRGLFTTDSHAGLTSRVLKVTCLCERPESANVRANLCALQCVDWRGGAVIV